MCDDVEGRLGTNHIELLVSCMKGRRIHLLILQSSCPPDPSPPFGLRKGCVMTFGEVKFLFRIKMEVLTYLPQNNANSGSAKRMKENLIEHVLCICFIHCYINQPFMCT